jgi:hypothetical protein
MYVYIYIYIYQFNTAEEYIFISKRVKSRSDFIGSVWHIDLALHASKVPSCVCVCVCVCMCVWVTPVPPGTLSRSVFLIHWSADPLRSAASFYRSEKCLVPSVFSFSKVPIKDDCIYDQNLAFLAFSAKCM